MKARGIDDFQRKTIYGIARSMGISEPGNREDGLHLLVAGITGKGSLKELSYREAADVIRGMSLALFKLLNHICSFPVR